MRLELLIHKKYQEITELKLEQMELRVYKFPQKSKNELTNINWK